MRLRQAGADKLLKICMYIFNLPVCNFIFISGALQDALPLLDGGPNWFGKCEYIQSRADCEQPYFVVKEEVVIGFPIQRPRKTDHGMLGEKNFLRKLLSAVGDNGLLTCAQ